jgi:hypothetical protein
MSETKGDSDAHTQIREAARAGRFDEVKELHARGASIQCAIIGAGEGKQGAIAQWALERGACLIFSFTQAPKTGGVTSHSYGKNVSMLRGPGEVSKGTFRESAST